MACYFIFRIILMILILQNLREYRIHLPTKKMMNSDRQVLRKNNWLNYLVIPHQNKDFRMCHWFNIGWIPIRNTIICQSVKSTAAVCNITFMWNRIFCISCNEIELSSSVGCTVEKELQVAIPSITLSFDSFCANRRAHSCHWKTKIKCCYSFLFHNLH